MADRFEDERGVIQDLLGPVDAVTQITSRPGAVRGNHTHERTEQWAYLVSGTMIFAWLEDDGVHTRDVTAPAIVHEPPGIPHAWKSVTDTTVLVFTRGPRSGTAYESDTIRLPENARLLT